MGLDGLSGPGIIGKGSLSVNNLSALFCRDRIISNSLLKAEPQTSIAYIISDYIKL